MNSTTEATRRHEDVSRRMTSAEMATVKAAPTLEHAIIRIYQQMLGPEFGTAKAIYPALVSIPTDQASEIMGEFGESNDNMRVWFDAGPSHYYDRNEAAERNTGEQR